MLDAKTVTTPLGYHTKLSVMQCPQSEEEKRRMEGIPYASCVGSILHDMVCSRSNLAYA
ncbi:GDSL esterase/lipase, partial [Trifolium pratense]